MKPKLPRGDSGSRFQFWEYRVSHKQLLIRCPKLRDESSNVDIKFYNVEYVDLSPTLLDLEIEEANQDDVSFVESRIGKRVPSERITVWKTSHGRHIIVAGNVVVSESRMDIFDSPFHLDPVDLDPEKLSSDDN